MIEETTRGSPSFGGGDGVSAAPLDRAGATCKDAASPGKHGDGSTCSVSPVISRQPVSCSGEGCSSGPGVFAVDLLRPGATREVCFIFF